VSNRLQFDFFFCIFSFVIITHNMNQLFVKKTKCINKICGFCLFCGSPGVSAMFNPP
jgi:hypothetical protein